MRKINTKLFTLFFLFTVFSNTLLAVGQTAWLSVKTESESNQKANLYVKVYYPGSDVTNEYWIDDMTIYGETGSLGMLFDENDYDIDYNCGGEDPTIYIGLQDPSDELRIDGFEVLFSGTKSDCDDIDATKFSYDKDSVVDKQGTCKVNWKSSRKIYDEFKLSSSCSMVKLTKRTKCNGDYKVECVE